MIIYEVNLHISASTFPEYFTWLTHHIDDMLAIPGFKRATLLKEVGEAAADPVRLSVQYAVESLSALDDYLLHHAEHMRGRVPAQFIGKFSAARRVLESIDKSDANA